LQRAWKLPQRPVLKGKYSAPTCIFTKRRRDVPFSGRRLRLVGLHMTPLQIRRLRLNRATAEDARWVSDTLNRINGPFGVRVELGSDGTLALVWP